MTDEKLELYTSNSMYDCKDFLYWHKKNNDVTENRLVASMSTGDAGQ